MWARTLEERSDLDNWDKEIALGIISNKEDYQIKQEDTTPLINNLEIIDVFKNEDGEEGAGVTDLIRQVERLLASANRLEELMAQVEIN